MLIGYFDSVPRELEQAALVDGATPSGALFRVLIPAACPDRRRRLFAFITAWGEVLFASVLTTDSTRTLAIGLQLRLAEQRLLEPAHGRLPRRQRPGRHRLPGAAALHRAPGLTSGAVK